MINKVKLMLGLPFNNTLSYQESASSFFVVINRSNGKTYEIESEPFICLHSVNAYEHENNIIMDLICHPPGNPYDSLYLANLRSSKPELTTGEIRRYSINLYSESCDQITLSSNTHEFPRINYRNYNGNHYQFVYTALITNLGDPFFNEIQKLNVQNGNIQRWGKPNYFLGEAVFVARTESQQEDDGVLLTIAFDASTQLSSLMIIDALSMHLVAEVYLPLHLPFGLHGNFYKNTQLRGSFKSIGSE